MKIRKRKAVFRVEYEVYAVGEREFLETCDLIDVQLRTQKEIVWTLDEGIQALAKIIPHKVRRMVR